MGVRYFLGLSILLSCFIAVPAMGQQDDPIWTTRPTQIDKSKQTYERLPPRESARDSRIWIVVPERIKVLDSRSFSVGDTVYELSHIRPIKTTRLCKAVEGGRWPCGRMASIFLGNTVRGKRLLCDIVQSGKKISLSRCVVGTREIAPAIIEQGYGKAEGDAALLARQAEAQTQAAKGLWRHPDCIANFDSC